jgi:hypothetical protein
MPLSSSSASLSGQRWSLLGIAVRLWLALKEGLMARRPFPTKAELLPYADKFWSGVAKAGDDDCWLWTLGKDGKGYGGIGIQGRSLRCHKIAYLLVKGDIPAGLQVRHECDNPPCCNPAHLILGTHKQNMEDMAARGRVGTLHGDRNPKAKLTAEQVQELLVLRQLGALQRELAARFNISQPVVKKIIHGDAYKNVPRPHFPLTEGAAQ